MMGRLVKAHGVPNAIWQYLIHTVETTTKIMLVYGR